MFYTYKDNHTDTINTMETAKFIVNECLYMYIRVRVSNIETLLKVNISESLEMCSQEYFSRYFFTRLLSSKYGGQTRVHTGRRYRETIAFHI